MLVLSRKLNEKLKIGGDITITVVEILPDRVKIGVTAPEAVKVLRSELLKQSPPARGANSHGLERPAS